MGAIPVVVAEAAEIAAPSSASDEPQSQEQAKPPAVAEASEREAAPPRGSPAPQRVVNDEPKRGIMKKVLIAVPLVLVIAIIGVVWSTSHVEVTVAPPKPPAISWGTSCKLTVPLLAAPGAALAAPNVMMAVTIVNAGSKIQEYSGYRVYFWHNGIIYAWWTSSGTSTYASVGESWTTSTNVSDLTDVQGDVNALLQARGSENQDGGPAVGWTCTVGKVTP